MQTTSISAINFAVPKQNEPPEKIVVSWTKEDWDARWPHRFEEMIETTPLTKAPFIVSLIKRAVEDFEKTGKIYERPGKYRAKARG